MNTTNPQLSWREAVALATDNGQTPRSKSELRDLLPRFTPAKLDSFLNVTIYTDKGIKRTGKGGQARFKATIPPEQFKAMIPAEPITATTTDPATAPPPEPTTAPTNGEAQAAAPGFKCTQCERAFRTDQRLKLHIGKTHGEKKTRRIKALAIREPIHAAELVANESAAREILNQAVARIRAMGLEVLPEFYHCCPKCGFGFRAIIPAMRLQENVEHALNGRH